MTKAALFLGTPDDTKYLPYLKSMFNGMDTFVCLQPFTLLTELEMYCGKRGITAVVSTNTAILSKLLAIQGNIKANPSLKNYAGSLFTFRGLEIVFVSPLAQIFTVSYGKFICERFISKVAAPNSWREPSDFKFGSGNIVSASNAQEWYAQFKTAYAISIDIETFRDPLSIRCIGYTGVFIGLDNAISTKSIVIPLTDTFLLEWARKFNDLPNQKIFQNGKYDNAYLLRYNAPIRNWQWDTAHLFHSWYSELPKDLAFLNAFFLRKVVYWKDLAETTDLFEYYKYNALDTWATANVWAQQLITMPEFARRNYSLEFPLVFPCLLAEMTGLLRDENRLISARKEIDAKIESQTTKLRKMLGVPGFNPNSPVQVKTLLKVLGCADITSTEEPELKKAAFRHPLNALFIELILDIRGLRKLTSTYLRTDDDAVETGKYAGEGGAKELSGTILYALNPHGTDTGRLASREHHFWCGLQIQNIPRGFEVKQTVMAARGFFFGECDLEQAESRDTAHIAGDTKLISATTGTKDFHSTNASAFFGKPYETIYDDGVGKTKDKPLRDLAKRVNHGANYNMGAAVLVDTMGFANIYEAGRLLGLPTKDAIKIAEYLLDRFHATYPKLRGKIAPFEVGTYYAWVVSEILVQKKLVSRAFHHTPYNLANYKAAEYIEKGDWTRYCFGKPDKSKQSLNAYVAHCPQSLNARTLNEGFMRVFYEIALRHPESFRLHAQIHDSILFSYRADSSHHADTVKQAMEIPVSVRDISGITRTFTVPAALKLGVNGKPATYWNETE